jgi:ATP-dependent helicase HrpA
VRPSDFDLAKLPNHLQMNVEVIDDQGLVTSKGRNLERLRVASRSAELAQSREESTAHDHWRRDGLTTWDLDNLPLELPVVRGGIQVLAYPALIDRGTAVDLRLVDTAAQADRLSRRAVARLYALASHKAIRSQVRWLPRWNEICVWATAAISPADLQDELTMRIAELAFVLTEGVPRDKAQFMARLDDSGERIGIATQELAALLPRLFEAYQQARVACEELAGTRFQAAQADIREQLRQLMYAGFLVDVPWNWLQQYPRYFLAIHCRADRLKSGGHVRDEEGMRVVERYWQRYRQQEQRNIQQNRVDWALTDYRWMIEEFRVSLFAQQLGTVIKISAQRLDKQWASVQTN